MNRRGILITLLVVALGLAAPAAAQTGMDAVVKFLETRYSVRHHGVPGLWVAKPFMLGSGVRGLKMATFEGLHISPEDRTAIRTELDRTLSEQWTPFVESRSNVDGDWSIIYARENGEKLELLIFASDHEDVTVLQMTASGKARDRWISEPGISTKHNRSHMQGDR